MSSSEKKEYLLHCVEEELWLEVARIAVTLREEEINREAFKKTVEFMQTIRSLEEELSKERLTPKYQQFEFNPSPQKEAMSIQDFARFQNLRDQQQRT